MPEDRQLEQAQRDYDTLDRERQAGVNAYCSRYPSSLWRSCFVVRVSRTKVLQDQENLEKQNRLDAHRAQQDKQKALRTQRKKERDDKQERLRQPRRMEGPPKPPSIAPQSIKDRYDTLRSGRSTSGREIDWIAMCLKTPSMWFCNPNKEEAVEEYARMQENQRLAANQRRRESGPPALTRSRADQIARDQSLAGMRPPSTRRV